MRILIKILLFPVTLILSVVVAACRFACHFSGAILGLTAGLVFTIALLALVLPIAAKPPLSTNLALFGVAFAISPYGIPKLADWLLDKLDDLNLVIRSI